jgi:hypothetical protein
VVVVVVVAAKEGRAGDGGDEAATGTVPILASWFLHAPK